MPVRVVPVPAIVDAPEEMARGGATTPGRACAGIDDGNHRLPGFTDWIERKSRKKPHKRITRGVGDGWTLKCGTRFNPLDLI
jgi:hypothetical protein